MRLLIVSLVAVLSACAANQEKTPDAGRIEQAARPSGFETQDAQYKALVEAIKAGQSDVFDDIRRTYVKTSHYAPYLGPELALGKSMRVSIDQQDWSACVEHGETLLETNYINLDAHYGSMVCHGEQGHITESEHHKYVLTGLIRAIWSTGDGKSPETAFFSTSTHELKAFLRLNGFEPISQALSHDGGKSYDIMKVKDRQTREELTLFFDITTQWQKLQKSKLAK